MYHNCEMVQSLAAIDVALLGNIDDADWRVCIRRRQRRYQVHMYVPTYICISNLPMYL